MKSTHDPQVAELRARADEIYVLNDAGLLGHKWLERERGCRLEHLPEAEFRGWLKAARRVTNLMSVEA